MIFSEFFGYGGFVEVMKKVLELRRRRRKWHTERDSSVIVWRFAKRVTFLFAIVTSLLSPSCLRGVI